MVFAIDFDNTIATHAYPFVGELIPLADKVIQLLNDNGHTCFMWTVRGEDKRNEFGVRDENGKFSALGNAKEFCKKHGIEFDYFNVSPIHPSSSPKQLADYVIDDINIGCPLTSYKGHIVVNWYEVAKILVKLGAITEKDFETLK